MTVIPLILRQRHRLPIHVRILRQILQIPQAWVAGRQRLQGRAQGLNVGRAIRIRRLHVDFKFWVDVQLAVDGRLLKRLRAAAVAAGFLPNMACFAAFGVAVLLLTQTARNDEVGRRAFRCQTRHFHRGCVQMRPFQQNPLASRQIDLIARADAAARTRHGETVVLAVVLVVQNRHRCAAFARLRQMAFVHVHPSRDVYGLRRQSHVVGRKHVTAVYAQRVACNQTHIARQTPHQRSRLALRCARFRQVAEVVLFAKDA